MHLATSAGRVRLVCDRPRIKGDMADGAVCGWVVGGGVAREGRGARWRRTFREGGPNSLAKSTCGVQGAVLCSSSIISCAHQAPTPISFLEIEKYLFRKARTRSQDQGVCGGRGLTQAWHCNPILRYNVACSNSSPPQLDDAKALLA